MHIFISFKLSRSLVIAVLVTVLLVGASYKLIFGLAVGTVGEGNAGGEKSADSAESAETKREFIRWVDFDVTCRAMESAMKLDIESADKEIHLNWIELLSVLAVKYGGDFSSFREKDLNSLAERLNNGEKIEDITRDMKYYSYYYDAYTAVLGEYLGNYRIQEPDPSDSGKKLWVERYGLKAFSPIARNYGYSHYDDFGASRSYGYKRKHLGHDMMGNVGTPVIAIESGIVEAIGWNQYGGWRLGIRSFDRKRYYYYAHLRKNHPYPVDLSLGHTVKAGDVIGYLGMTGYSSKENVNNIDTPHLHMGIQLIFDESQKDGNGEIWIDCYELVRFLSKNTSAVFKNEETNEYMRRYDFFEDSVENME